MKTSTPNSARNRFLHGLRLWLLTACMLIVGGRAMATTYYSYGNGSSTNLASWWTVNNGTGSNPANFTSGDTFIIQSGSSYTGTTPWTVSGTGAAIQINGALTVSNT